MPVTKHYAGASEPQVRALHDESQKAGQIEQEIITLRQACENVHKMAAALAGQLEPVLMPAVPQKNDEARGQSAIPLVAALQECQSTVEVAVGILQDVVERFSY